MADSVENKRNRPRENVKILYDYELTNAPGKSIVGLEVHYGPLGWTPPHTHSGATVAATVIKGQLLSGMNGNPPKVYSAGESFNELPGCHHTVSDNPSETEDTTFIAVMVIDTEIVKKGYQNLVVLDKEWQ
ncbi:cupin domain protein [Fusarium tjaetaba]|uniref:Cupin domain protein n=1 Tax=Fusarium tjaetaba TaxID=1567544 RepID=A0A8H5VF20_9HYPO|nr:cupin domain protein [Fusarium tjaetaba]KAF5621106.1 cupin domain protein [Fusarium tjaetaba]